MRRYKVAHNPSNYLIDANNTINVFLMETSNLDPLTGLPAGGSADGGHVLQVGTCSSSGSNAMWACIESPWTAYINSNSQPWHYAGLLNHEISHLLGLNHTWDGTSGCADAPRNANCWNLNEPNIPACDAPSKISNNVMDTNVSKSSLSPCQIDIIHRNLANCLSPYVLSCSNCLPTYVNFKLVPHPKLRGTGNIALDGRATFGENWFTLEIDQVDASNTVIAGTNYTSTFWRDLGIEHLSALYAFGSGNRYRIRVSIGNGCGATATQTEYTYVR